MAKVIYEYWYNYGKDRDVTGYELRITKETPKMFYGDVCNLRGFSVTKFAIKRNDIDKLTIKRNLWGIEYRVWVNADTEAEARKIAKNRIYTHIMKTADEFMESE